MKKNILVGLLWLGVLATSSAGIYYQGTGVSGETFEGSVANPTIVDGNPAAVIANTMTLSGLGSSLSGLTVTLNITGGNNSGLYAYLVNGSTTVTLMNQPGVSLSNPFGATGAGMNITLQDGVVANGSIQNETTGSVLSGAYNAEGSLSSFNGSNPNGDWTLYFADTVARGRRCYVDWLEPGHHGRAGTGERGAGAV